MRNLLLTLSYDGSGYHGWQIQENAPTVQEAFQAALYRATGLREDLKACSRTDTGVHAREFCVSLKTESRIPPQRLAAALNHYLPPDIAVKSCRPVPEDFHARYSCKGKEYCYEIWNHPVRDPFRQGRASITGTPSTRPCWTGLPKPTWAATTSPLSAPWTSGKRATCAARFPPPGWSGGGIWWFSP